MKTDPRRVMATDDFNRVFAVLKQLEKLDIPTGSESGNNIGDLGGLFNDGQLLMPIRAEFKTVYRDVHIATGYNTYLHKYITVLKDKGGVHFITSCEKHLEAEEQHKAIIKKVLRHEKMTERTVTGEIRVFNLKF